MIATLLDRDGLLRHVRVHGTKTTRNDMPVVAINGELHVVRELDEVDD